MVQKIIQVPVDAQLLEQLDATSSDRGQSRSAFIRDACRELLRRLDEEEKDRAYAEGYRRFPETTEFGEAQLAVIAEVWGKEENW